MEIKPITEENSVQKSVEALEVAKSVVEPVQAMPLASKETITTSTPAMASPDVSPSLDNSADNVAVVPEPDPSVNLWIQVNQLWEQYFGEGKKSNLILVITILATIPLLIAASALLGFLEKLPILPSIFELVGFGYSVWFVYRYLLFANTRQEITDAIASWKLKIFG
ncbi:MAG: CAAD domain-containing protein [Pseudanabaenaceae cyanobacterium bins.39]|nr:CAAD domain-containing protein [Pseudanabaenaceae cyanobacterium bins.39]